jgi:hypothetical protein
MIPKVHGAYYVVCLMFRISNINIQNDLFWLLSLIMKCGIIFGDNLPYSKRCLQKKIARIMVGAKPKITC